jgi:hypothetical protein
MFVCTECSKNLKNKERVFSGTDWCRACVRAESQRSIREDSVQGAAIWFRSRPARYMLQPEQYEVFGYKKKV